jgi:hypothetical protein
MKYIGVLGSLILSACAAGHSSQLESPRNDNLSVASSRSSQIESPVVRNDPIRQVDFRNFTYDWYPVDYDVPATGRKIVLKNGTMDTGFRYGKEPRQFFLREFKYGDLTSDGSEEAIVVLQIITSGTARPSLIFVYKMLSDGPRRLWVYQTGDRWDHGYHDASIRDGQLLIERYKPSVIKYQGQKHDMSASEAYIRDYYKWDGTSFRKIKTEETPVDPTDKNRWAVHNDKP